MAVGYSCALPKEGVLVKKIRALVPLDASDFSRQAVRVAVETLYPPMIHIALLHVAASLDLPAQLRKEVQVFGATDLEANGVRTARSPQLPDVAAPVVTVIADLKRSLETDVMVLEAKGFKVSTIIRFGQPATEIISEAENGCDLIVMATHGRSGLNRLVMGSVAEKVMRHAKVPVMMVKPA